MFCKNCGKELDDNAVVCLGCGCDPRKGNKFCSNCGVEVQNNQIVCVKCGTSLKKGLSLSAPGNIVVQTRSKLVYLLLAIFLGAFGVHNFYAGYTTNGVIQLIVTVVGSFWTCGIAGIVVWIWAVIEGVTQKADASGRPFDP